MLKFCFILYTILMIAMLFFAILFRKLGRKSKFLFPGFDRLPKDLQKEVDFDRAAIDASDECIGWIFYFLICVALLTSSWVLSLLMSILYPVYIIRCFTCDPMLIFGAYIKIGPRNREEVEE